MFSKEWLLQPAQMVLFNKHCINEGLEKSAPQNNVEAQPFKHPSRMSKWKI